MTYLPGMKDGDDVAEGATTDSAVTGDVPGTLSAKARGLSKIWADVWDQVNHRITVGSTILNASLRATSLDGDNATVGTTTDAVTALTLVGLLKAIKASLAGVLNTRALSSGTDSVTVNGTVTVTDSVALPVVLPAAQVTTLTPPTSVGVTNFPTTAAGAPNATAVTTVQGVTSGTPLPVTDAPSATFYDGTAAVTTVAAAIGPSQACASVILQADPANTVTILVGNGTGQHFALLARDSLQLTVANVALVYARTATGTATLNYLARS